MLFQGKKIIDLSQEIYTGMPVYPGHAKTVIWEHVSHEETKRNLGTGFSYQSSGIIDVRSWTDARGFGEPSLAGPQGSLGGRNSLEHCVTSAFVST